MRVNEISEKTFSKNFKNILFPIFGFLRFLQKKLSGVQWVTSLIIIWSYGTDERLLNNWRNDLLHFSALCDFFSEKLFCQNVLHPFHVHKCSRLEKSGLGA